MNRQTKENFLMHWNLLEGAKAKIHKYIAREDTGKKTKTGGTAYRYFYTQASWDKFKGKVDNVVSAMKQGVDAVSKLGSNFANSLISGIGSKITFGSKSSPPSANVNELSRSEKASLGAKFSLGMLNPSMWSGAAQATADAQKRSDANKTYTTKTGCQVTENTAKVGKWIAKVKLSNGKVRYFYDEKQYKRWKEVQTYQENEPAYLKKFKEIEPRADNGRMPSIEDDYTLTNDIDSKPSTVTRSACSTNCPYTALAYEMRRRGYDVEAVPLKSEHCEDAYDAFYRDSSGNKIGPLISTSSMSVGGKTVNTQTVTETANVIGYPALTEAEAKKVALNKSIGVKSGTDVRSVPKTKAMLEEKFPVGSRGSCMVWWSSGGGHCYSWEMTSDGVRFIDPQVNKEYSDAFFQKVLRASDPEQALTFVRTDNLVIQKEATDYVRDRKLGDVEVTTNKNTDGKDIHLNNAADWWDSKRLVGAQYL